MSSLKGLKESPMIDVAAFVSPMKCISKGNEFLKLARKSFLLLFYILNKIFLIFRVIKNLYCLIEIFIFYLIFFKYIS